MRSLEASLIESHSTIEKVKAQAAQANDDVESARAMAAAATTASAQALLGSATGVGGEDGSGRVASSVAYLEDKLNKDRADNAERLVKQVR